MKNEMLLKKLYDIQNAGYTGMGKLDELIADIRAEMEQETLSLNGIDIQKAAAKFAKECYKEYMGIRPGIAGANMYPHGSDDDMRQYICNGYIGVSYSKPFEGLMEVPETARKQPIAFYKVIPPYMEPVTLPPYTELKQAVKMESANKASNKYVKNGNGKKDFAVRLENGQAFCASYLLKVMELAGMTEDGNGAADGKGGVSPVALRNEIDGNEIVAVILPYRPDYKFDSSRLLLDYCQG